MPKYRVQAVERIYKEIEIESDLSLDEIKQQARDGELDTLDFADQEGGHEFEVFWADIEEVGGVERENLS